MMGLGGRGTGEPEAWWLPVPCLHSPVWAAFLGGSRWELVER